MNKFHRLQIDLTLLGPILTQGSEPGEPGIDAPVARNGEGRVMLPGTLVKGKILDAFRDMSLPNEQWLGKPSADGDWDPERGKLSFSDFVTEKKEQPAEDQDKVIERIQLDDSTGSVQRGMMAMLEAPYGYEEPVKFEGHIDFIADEAEAEQIKKTLETAFKFVSSYGAMRTVGFGRTKDVTITRNVAPKQSHNSPATGTQLPFQLKLDRPLCVVGRKHSGNHFDSLECIPGQVLKGAVARLILELNGSTEKTIDPSRPLKRFPKLCQHFEQLRFNEAKPMKVGELLRPVEPPLSIVAVPDGLKLYEDVSRCKEAKLFATKPEKGGYLAAPVFQPDWKGKDFEAVRGAFGWHDMPKTRRVRTSIDPDKWKAKDEALFSYGLILNKTKEAEFIWESVIGLEGLTADVAQVRQELQDLLQHGLPFIGKTRAIGEITWLSQRTPPKVHPKPLKDGLHVVTLQTDCLMTNLATLKQSAESLHSAYADFWKEVSGGSLELQWFFAKQVLHGGYVSKRSNRDDYKPFLLTERGSCFVLKVVDSAKAEVCLKKWADEPLPTPKWVSQVYGSSGKALWQVCPFLPQVGYGEVAIDLEMPKSLEDKS